MKPGSWVVLFGVLLVSPACRHRMPVGAAEDGGGQLQDGLAPDAFTGDFHRPAMDVGTSKVCAGGRIAPRVYHEPRGNFTLAVTGKFKVHTVSVNNADALLSAAAFNDAPGVAGLAATHKGGGAPAAELNAIRARLVAALKADGIKAQVFQRVSGTVGKSHEGYVDAREALWDVSAEAPLGPARLRDLLLAAVVNRPGEDLSGLPAGAVTASPQKKLTLALTLVARPGQVAVTGAAATTADDEDPTVDISTRLRDHGNGTSLAKGGSTPRAACDAETIKKMPTADIIWVVDESGSMDDNRKDIVNHANLLFKQAVAAGLDFRMGVTGVKDPSDSFNKPPGKFCSVASKSVSHDGGSDRFLLPSEAAIFSACVKNPPFYEGGKEFGLLAARAAVESHLPRAANRPDRIRPGAKLVIIVATDEVPYTLVSSVTSYDACTLSKSIQKEVGQHLELTMNLLTGKSDPEAAAMFHVIGGTCGNTCGADVAHGYRELASALKGQVGDVCQKNLSKTLQAIIDSVVGSASPLVLDHVPISSTLAVTVGGVRLTRHGSGGFVYNPAFNSLSFVSTQAKKGQGVIVSYSYF